MRGGAGSSGEAGECLSERNGAGCGRVVPSGAVEPYGGCGWRGLGCVGGPAGNGGWPVRGTLRQGPQARTGLPCRCAGQDMRVVCQRGRLGFVRVVVCWGMHAQGTAGLMDACKVDCRRGVISQVLLPVAALFDGEMVRWGTRTRVATLRKWHVCHTLIRQADADH